jgi:hypothetical protein
VRESSPQKASTPVLEPHYNIHVTILDFKMKQNSGGKWTTSPFNTNLLFHPGSWNAAAHCAKMPPTPKTCSGNCCATANCWASNSHWQHPVAGYVADFYFHEARLVIELDGGGHADDKQAVYDADRTRKLEVIGLRVMRFWDNQVLQETQAVLETIAGELMNHVDDVNQYPHPASPNPLAGALRGERRSALRNLTE